MMGMQYRWAGTGKARDKGRVPGGVIESGCRPCVVLRYATGPHHSPVSCKINIVSSGTLHAGRYQYAAARI